MLMRDKFKHDLKHCESEKELISIFNELLKYTMKLEDLFCDEYGRDIEHVEICHEENNK